MVHLRALYSAEMHMWLALHAHRQVHPQQFTVVTHRAQEACRILKAWVHGNATENAEAKSSVKQVSAARKARGKTASARAVASTTRRTKASKLPSTPKRPRGRYLHLTLVVISNKCIRVPCVPNGGVASQAEGQGRPHPQS